MGKLSLKTPFHIHTDGIMMGVSPDFPTTTQGPHYGRQQEKSPYRRPQPN
jgi:hypothetical protein